MCCDGGALKRGWGGWGGTQPCPICQGPRVPPLGPGLRVRHCPLPKCVLFCFEAAIARRGGEMTCFLLSLLTASDLWRKFLSQEG